MQPHVEFLFQEGSEDFLVIVDNLGAQCGLLGGHFPSFNRSCRCHELVLVFFKLRLRGLLWDRRIYRELYCHLVIIWEDSDRLLVANHEVEKRSDDLPRCELMRSVINRHSV